MDAFSEGDKGRPTNGHFGTSQQPVLKKRELEELEDEIGQLKDRLEKLVVINRSLLRKGQE